MWSWQPVLLQGAMADSYIYLFSFLFNRYELFCFVFLKKWKHLGNSKRGWDSAKKLCFLSTLINLTFIVNSPCFVYSVEIIKEKMHQPIFCDFQWKQEVVSYWKHYLYTFYIPHPVLFICFVFSGIKVTYLTAMCSLKLLTQV